MSHDLRHLCHTTSYIYMNINRCHKLKYTPSEKSLNILFKFHTFYVASEVLGTKKQISQIQGEIIATVSHY